MHRCGMGLIHLGGLLAHKVFMMKPVVVCALLVSVGVGVHTWNRGWLFPAGDSVTPASQVVRIHGFPAAETFQILVSCGARSAGHASVPGTACTSTCGAQGALEGLLSAACKRHASCSEQQADSSDEKLHALRFEADRAETTLVYYTAADQTSEGFPSSRRSRRCRWLPGL